MSDGATEMMRDFPGSLVASADKLQATFNALSDIDTAEIMRDKMDVADMFQRRHPEHAKPRPPSASDILAQAEKEMADRARTYDKPEGERSMGATVEAFYAVTGHSLTEEQGWLFMALLKSVRSQQGEYRADSYTDGAAYFALAGESAARMR